MAGAEARTEHGNSVPGDAFIAVRCPALAMVLRDLKGAIRWPFQISVHLRVPVAIRCSRAWLALFQVLSADVVPKKFPVQATGDNGSVGRGNHKNAVGTLGMRLSPFKI